MTLDITVNGKAHRLDAAPGETLLEVLRRLGFKGVKKSCETGNCGACTVLLDGRPVASCILLAAQADGHSVVTVEGLAEDLRLHAMQEAFIEAGAPQCGYCTPGMLLTSVALVTRHPEPSRDEIREAISGNLCRCSGYVKIVDAIEKAAAQLGRSRYHKAPARADASRTAAGRPSTSRSAARRKKA